MRPRLHAPQRPLLLTLVLACLLPLLVALSLGAAPSSEAKPPAPGSDFALLPKHCQDVTQPLPATPCQITDFGRKAPLVIVWGDSHAWMYQRAYVRAARRTHVNLELFIEGGCPAAIPQPLKDGETRTKCETRDQEILDQIKQLRRDHRDFKVVLVGFWSGYRIGWKQTHDPLHPRPGRYTDYDRRIFTLWRKGSGPLFAELGRLKVDVDVVAQAGTVPPNAPDCAAGYEPYQCPLKRRLAMHDETVNRRWLHRMVAQLDPRTTPMTIDPSPAYCDDRFCYGVVDGHNTWYDAIHLAKGMTETMASYFVPSFAELADAAKK